MKKSKPHQDHVVVFWDEAQHFAETEYDRRANEEILRLRKALTDIKQHEELIAGHSRLSHYSRIWKLANKALKGDEA